MQWGPEIEVNGVRPAWLADDDEVTCARGWSDTGSRPAKSITNWYPGRAIRLPADHSYYVATERGFTYWPGGQAAPSDADLNGDALFRNGREVKGNLAGCYWDHTGQPGDIIGYRKKPEFGRIHTDGSRSGGQPVEDYRALWEKSQDELATVRAELQQSDEALVGVVKRFGPPPEPVEIGYGPWVTPTDGRQPNWAEGAEYQMAASDTDYVNPATHKMGKFRGTQTRTRYRRVYRMVDGKVRIGQEWLTPEEIEARLKPARDDQLTITITGPQGSGKTRWAEFILNIGKYIGLPIPTVVEPA